MASADSSKASLFPIRSAIRFTVRPTRYGFGDMTFTGANPAYGALISYYLPANSEEVRLQILDAAGSVVRTVRATHSPGLNRVAWDLRYSGPAGQTLGGGERRSNEARGPQAVPGNYKARLTVDGQTYESLFQVILDPGLQFEVASGLTKMQSAVNAALAKPGVDAQELARPRNLGRSETGPRLKEKLEAFFTMIDGVNAAPTAAQMRYYQELQDEFKKAVPQP
jgi:hypothetical protein